MKVSELSLRTITFIQILIATAVSLLFQFVIPVEWQPLTTALPANPEGENIIFFTASQWFFSLSIAWLFYRDNKYLNNLLMHSFIPISLMLVQEFFFIGLYHDWYHFFPFAVDVYLVWKKRDTLNQKTFLYFTIFLTVWLYLVYFMKLAYFGAPLIEVFLRYLISLILEIGFSFILRKKKKDLIDLPAT